MKTETQHALVPEEKRTRRIYTPEEQLKRAQSKVREIKLKAWKKCLDRIGDAMVALGEAVEMLPEDAASDIRKTLTDHSTSITVFHAKSMQVAADTIGE